MIYDLLDPISLAHWIMGDGVKLNKSLVLCTDSFSLQEVVDLRNILEIKFNLKSSIIVWKNNGTQIYFLQESKSKLIKLVEPHILPSLVYKKKIK